MKQSRQSGFSIVEVMVTILIVSFGIMGLAGLQAQMIVAEIESFDRAQAVVSLDDMVARMNGLRSVLNAGNSSSFVVAPDAPVGSGGSVACARDADITDSVQREASFQICEWTNLLRGSSEKVGTTNVGGAPDMRGCIELLSAAGATPVQYRISVAWRGRTKGFTSAALTCATGVYGAEANGRRRIVSSTVSVPNLSGS